MKFAFCEGRDDQLVIQSLVKHLGLNVRVEHTTGKDNLSNFLKSLLKRPEFAQQQVDSIGIFRDANGDSRAAFTSVRDALQQNAFVPPAAYGTYGSGTPRAGVCIVGVNGRGMIEDVCLESIKDRPEFPCVDEYFACIVKKSARNKFLSKAKVRVWMASQADYELYVGKAAEGGYWPWENPIFDSIKNFLKAL
jgi:hypothetical protein